MQYPYASAFSEGSDPAICNHQAKDTLCYRRTLREIATLPNCEPTETTILTQSQAMRLSALTQYCLVWL